MELHSQASDEDLVRLPRAWHKLGADKYNETFEIVACCTGVIGDRNLCCKASVKTGEGK